MIRTNRLILRGWQDTDRRPLAEIVGNPQVMRYFHLTRNREQSDAWIARSQAHIDKHGFGIWAVEILKTSELIGFVGLSTVPDYLPCAPTIEAVWTLSDAYWRHGYCAEAAQATMTDGFSRLGLSEIVAFTAAINIPSRCIMEKLGMIYDVGGDFIHPRIPTGHALAPHVLYRKQK